ncbi:HD-GYP domain-containing protein [Rhizobium sp. VS19-DR104.2]|uniref:HD-GYP domain-containing protein n=1 Tax=unclassified Rhizobium TaxID=2613769 RepID=UPI001C5B9C30|nr:MULTISPECIES: HD-GYP domain-containing protein [unclassified Rhizobium]MBZ5763072.1 HD-GYP domain-containing protein [Rhizobium sp. VS19-DR96]MBZ5768948.1 HD-GYP domain-containing protein [Rhizobium sp. VS19-DR129.2]MBZ5776566.1 HD-GYP domain-containing protein [Rhizobium sp. VS19-DRK62.2]MBZ5787695.1 HD-GYP domain-containing protein [Rhizobium sp. VS19-DR121]MBZ5805068.1 HD-GYP domain-containing protein [Rhizobium sp. VS19-DR181]
MLKRIGKDQLRIGMFIEALEGVWQDTPNAGRRFQLNREDLATSLKDSRISGIVINTSKGLDVSPSSSMQLGTDVLAPPVRTLSTSSTRQARVLTAEKIKRSSALLKDIFNGVSAGSAVTVEMVAPVIEEITSSVDLNPSILISMTRLKTKDQATFLHSLAVAALMIRLARHLKLDAAMVALLGMSGLVHDIGKIGMPIEILTKAGPLTDSEMDLVRRHPSLGHHILSRGKGMPDVVLDVCLHHHERLDGKGYPIGLTVPQLSFYARMAAICDVYDALTSARPYKKPWTSLDAASWMLDTEGAFDRPLLHQFIDGVIRA